MGWVLRGSERLLDGLAAKCSVFRGEMVWAGVGCVMCARRIESRV